MPISQNKYIDVTTYAVTDNNLNRKSMVTRIFTPNELIPNNTVVVFYSSEAVKTYFGATSDEYKFAKKYFDYIKDSSSASKEISFARYTTAAVAAQLIATKQSATLEQFKAVTAGSLHISINGVGTDLTEIDLSGCADLAAVASALQTSIRAYTLGEEAFTGATVAYDATKGVFKLTGGIAGDCPIEVASAAASGTDLSALLRWNADNKPVISNGVNARSLTQFLDNDSQLSNNFGSFAFFSITAQADIVEIAQWNHNKNAQYMYSLSVNASNYESIQEAVKNFDGVALTYDIHNDMAYYMPMVLMAITNYDETDGVINYMFKKFPNDLPSVIDDATSDTLDNLKINYLGSTSQSNTTLSFYQPGYLQGSVSDMGVYANEIWLKDYVVTAGLQLLINKKRVPANINGKNMFIAVLQEAANKAINNGTIDLGKTLNASEIAYVTSIANGDVNAYKGVEQNGYWYNVDIIKENVGDTYKNVLKYILIYTKGESIRKIEGSHILV